ncbi:MAG TPA: glycosyltransferase [Burkholderiales bacterium]
MKLQADPSRALDNNLVFLKPDLAEVRIAVLLPCYNEGLSIRRVVESFRAVLPAADIYVYDNRSTDNTAVEAAAAGAIVRAEPWPGKGNVVRRMFADVNADVYLMADGDGTYDASAAPEMVARLIDGHLDMIVGTRRNIYEEAHRAGHAFGNRLFNTLYRSLFGRLFTDIFSGYRVFSRRYVKTFPAVSRGFEIETEMSVHASQLRLPIVEMATAYGERQEGSASKLKTFQDAAKILRMFLLLFKEVQPLMFYGAIASLLALVSVALGIPLIQTFMETGLVPRFPTAILATGLMLLAAVTLACGLILDSVARGRLEHKRTAYLAYHPPLG